jgi:hypothetical protein
MKQAFARVCCPALTGWITWLVAPLRSLRELRRLAPPKPLSSYMLRDIGLADDAHGDHLYGNFRRRW